LVPLNWEARVLPEPLAPGSPYGALGAGGSHTSLNPPKLTGLKVELVAHGVVVAGRVPLSSNVTVALVAGAEAPLFGPRLATRIRV
jgi:hypothetical protein